MADYTQMTNAEFEAILETLVGEMSPGAILSISGVREEIVEELNNDVLDRWAEENQAKAYPGEDDDA